MNIFHRIIDIYKEVVCHIGEKIPRVLYGPYVIRSSTGLCASVSKLYTNLDVQTVSFETCLNQGQLYTLEQLGSNIRQIQNPLSVPINYSSANVS
jgi:hypothetical protein